MRSGLLLAIVISLSLFALFHPVGLALAEAEKKNEVRQQVTEEQKATLIELFSMGTVLPKSLIDLQSRLDSDTDVLKIDEELPELQKEIGELQWDTNAAGTNPDLQLMEISGFQNSVHRISARLENLRKPITATIKTLTKTRKMWQKHRKTIEAVSLEDIENIELAEEQLKTLEETIKTAFTLLEKRLGLALRLGKKLGDMQISLHEVESDLKDLAEEKVSASIQQTSPSMLSLEFYEKFKASVLQQASSNIVLVAKEQVALIKKHHRIIIINVVVVAIIALMLKNSKKLAPPASRWHPFASCYLATALFMTTTFNASRDMLGETIEMPHHWQSFLHIIMLLAVIRLTSPLVPNRWQRGLLIPLTAFMILIVCMVVVDLPQIFMHLFVFYVSLVALVLYFIQLPVIKKISPRASWFGRFLGLVPAVVVVAGVFGYDQFAVMIFATVLSAITASLIIWVMYLLALGLLDLLLSVIPFVLLRENREKILKRLQPIVASLHLLLFAAVQLVVWDLHGTVNDAAQVIFNSGFELGGFSITAGFLLAVTFILYSTLLLSKGIQALLLSKLLPRYGAEKGVQLSIARLVHYAILTIGFLFVLRVLGFESNQLTILGGALGVGIGFGLQAIVNNFASGLILLFERPIKVGDTIQIGTELGEVKNMGLRATIIQTFDNAEIVVPNSDLVTGQVTNWTLAERKVRVRIPVGVAYGTEVSEVLEILLGCADSNPMVLSKPAPQAFFLAFGASSLDFELRVWIPEFLDKTQILSDLNQDIENEFAINDIEVPFPQTDLHLKSVDVDAVRSLGGVST